MKSSLKHIIIVAFFAIVLIPCKGQNTLRSSYFSENSIYRSRLNPAFAPDKSYFSIPLLGNMNLSMQSNIGVKNLIYKRTDGSLTTFMNSFVNPNDFLGDLKGRSKFNADIDITLFSKGFRAFNGFNTVEMNWRTNVRGSIPKDLFAFMKEGQTSEQTNYEIENMGLKTMSYFEMAFGHTHRINDKWVVGGKFKLLFGLYNMDINFDKMEMTLTDDIWNIKGTGEMNFGVKGLEVPTKQEAGREYDTADQADLISWEDIDIESPGFGGMGFAIDLGVTWQINKDWELSMALLDLGFIRWNNVCANMGGEWSFDGFDNVAIDPEESYSNYDNELDDQWDALTDDLEDCFNFKKENKKTKKAKALGATLNIGTSYKLPAYDKLSFGFLSSTRIDGKYSWSEGRFSANIAPVRVFDANINYAISSFGSSFGWLCNFYCKGFNLFIGSDHQFLHLTPQFLPVGRANMSMNFGINIPFGKSKRI